MALGRYGTVTVERGTFTVLHYRNGILGPITCVTTYPTEFCRCGAYKLAWPGRGNGTH